ncbi:SRPBCC domain-containing protein [Nocardia sp. NBC_01327]|uniref:SRPBCC domain-containing protein n=1 Tax=Nocardia sp. NBC_01327 TaxID=2903593 RepID=UPI002E0F2EE8|nr:SRPBCC domain-containing protein [Nocardia sp. NBC_01327]
MAFVIDNSVEIDAPAELVWQVLTDVDKYGEWNPFVPSCQTTLEPGTPIDMQVRLGGKNPRKQREFIYSHTPGKEFSYRMKPVPGLLRSQRQHILTPLDDGRTLYESHFYIAGPLNPLVGGLFGGAMRQGFGGMTDGLKKRAESLNAVRD